MLGMGRTGEHHQTAQLSTQHHIIHPVYQSQSLTSHYDFVPPNWEDSRIIYRDQSICVNLLHHLGPAEIGDISTGFQYLLIYVEHWASCDS